MKRLASALLLLCAASAAQAHDVWLSLDGDPSARRVVVNYGHPGDRPPAFADKVVSLDVITADAVRSLRPGLKEARLGDIGIAAASLPDTAPVLLAARYDNGFWSEDAAGFRNATPRTMPGAKQTVWSGKFAKAVTAPGAPFGRVLGHDIELVPLGDPATLKVGGALKLRVLFRGVPLVGIAVERGDSVTALAESDIPRFVTDAEGIATVPIVTAGQTLIVADHRVSPSATPALASADLYNATLWFVVGE